MCRGHWGQQLCNDEFPNNPISISIQFGSGRLVHASQKLTMKETSNQHTLLTIQQLHLKKERYTLKKALRTNQHVKLEEAC